MVSAPLVMVLPHQGRNAQGLAILVVTPAVLVMVVVTPVMLVLVMRPAVGGDAVDGGGRMQLRLLMLQVVVVVHARLAGSGRRRLELATPVGVALYLEVWGQSLAFSCR